MTILEMADEILDMIPREVLIREGGAKNSIKQTIDLTFTFYVL